VNKFQKLISPYFNNLQIWKTSYAQFYVSNLSLVFSATYKTESPFTVISELNRLPTQIRKCKNIKGVPQSVYRMDPIHMPQAGVILAINTSGKYLKEGHI